MNLIDQFPAVSIKVRAKLKVQQGNYSPVIAIEPRATVTEKALTDFYDNEFRKWHIKVALIILGLLTGMYFMVLNLPKLFNLINTYRIE